MMRHRQSRLQAQGLTMVELMVVLAVLAVIVLIAAPSFRDLIEIQRLRGINAQLVTDLHAGRATAVARGSVLRVSFRSNGSMTCYSLYTAPGNATRCDCRLGPGSACTGAMVEVRTVQVPTSLGVTVAPPSGYAAAFGFDPVTGGLISIPIDDFSTPIDQIVIEAYLDAARKLRTVLNRAGRPTVCSPAGSRMTEAACAP